MVIASVTDHCASCSSRRSAIGTVANCRPCCSAEGLQARGHACRFVARRDGVLVERALSRGLPVLTISGRGRRPASLWRIRRELRSFRPHVLHYNDPHAMHAAGVASLGLPIPLRIAARRVDFPLRSAMPYRMFCDGVVCVSQAVRRMCAAAGLPPGRLPVVHDGVDPLRMGQADAVRGRALLGIEPHVPLLLTVAKLTDHKGHRYLLDALPHVLQQYPNAVLALAGEGPQRDALTAQVRQLNLVDHVRFLGYRPEIPDLLAAADLLVVPSWLEGLCSSIIDAMFLGCPVVATRAGGIPDLLEGSDSPSQSAGWLVPPRDAAALSAAIREALQSPHLRQQFARRARQRAESQFRASVMVDRTLDAYRRLMRLRQPTGERDRAISAKDALVSEMNRNRSAC